MAVAPVSQEIVPLNHMIIRLDPADPAGTMKILEERWNEMLPSYPFESNFVSEVIDSQYRSEERMSGLLKIFTMVALLLAAMGLFALSSFSAQRRAHEIGIRKTLGALDHQIMLMMIRDFSLYILISLVIAIPSTWFIARWWLNEFSFRISLDPDLFLLSSSITITIAILTVLFHAIRISRTNPVESLRHE
jgi:putative ABC transport system permease protein